MKRLLLLLIVAVALIAAAVGVWRVSQSRDASTSVDGKRAVVLAGAPARTNTSDPGLRPEAGTYAYTGSGTESISLLGGSSREFPNDIYGVVELGDTGACAWTLNLVFVEEHVEERRYCTDVRGVRDQGFSRTTVFLGREQTSAYECGDAAMRIQANEAVGSSWQWSCTEARGGVVRYRATLVGTRPIEIDGVRAPASHVRIVATQRDKSRGDERSDWWLLATGLPARVRSSRTLTTDAGPLGDMTTTEAYEYELASLVPARS